MKVQVMRIEEDKNFMRGRKMSEREEIKALERIAVADKAIKAAADRIATTITPAFLRARNLTH